MFRRMTPTAPPPATHSGPAISLAKVQDDAPGLVSLVKAAAVSLDKSGLTGQRAAVYLVLDHSGSMTGFYGDGSVQRLAEQALGLSVNLDDDGTVPLVFFGSYAEKPIPVALINYQGVIDREHHRVQWGSTDYVAAMNAVVQHYQASGATDPAFVIFQTDGEPNDRGAVERALQNASEFPVFWAFVGFGNSIGFLKKLDDLRGRKVDNASFFHAARPQSVSDAELYDGLTHEYAAWLGAASAAGILR